MTKVGLVSLARRGFDQDYARQVYSLSAEALGSTMPGAKVVLPEDLLVTSADVEAAAQLLRREEVDALIIQNGTFADGLPASVFAGELDVPLALWALPEPSLDGGALRLNSLCGVNLGATTLAGLGRRFKYFYGHPEDSELERELRRFVRVAATRQTLRHTTIGAVGTRPPGFYRSTVNEFALLRLCGTRIHQLTPRDVMVAAEAASPEAARAALAEFEDRYDATRIVTIQLEKLGRVLVGFRKIIADNSLGGLAVRCWPEFPAEYGLAVCAVLSRLVDDGTMAGCEADVLGTVTMLIQRELTGEAAFIADLIAVDRADNTALFWHCGNAPTSLVAPGQRPRLSEHYVRKVGATVDATLRAGTVTIARLTEQDGAFRMLIARGEAIEGPMAVQGTSVRVRVEPSAQRLLDTIIYQGFEHHTSLCYGDVTFELRDLCELLGIEVVAI